jgi:hypothetical protein
MCDSVEEHDAAVEKEWAYWRTFFAALPRQPSEYDHECEGRGLSCDDCGRPLTGDALDDSIGRLEMQADAIADARNWSSK